MNTCRIMVVEDEALVAMDIEERLIAMSYGLAGRAASGDEAVELARRERPDLVLMDIRLQGEMDGIAAAIRIQENRPVPVIFLTAYSEDETLERAKLAEPFGFLLKPFDDRELKSAIEIALYKHRAEDEIRRLNRLYTVLSQVNQAIARIGSREELLPAICRLMVERGGIDYAWIGWRDPGTSEMSSLGRWGKEDEIPGRMGLFTRGYHPGECNPGEAVQQGRSLVCNDCAKDACLRPLAPSPGQCGFRSCASFLLRFKGEPGGTLNLYTAEPAFFQEREIGLLEEVAMDISFALDKMEGEAQRDRLNRELQRQSVFLQTLMDAMPYPVFYKGTDLRYLGCNRAFEEFIGITRDRIIGKTVHDIWPLDLAEFCHSLDSEILRSGAPHLGEGALQGADGLRHDVRFHKATFESLDGTVAGIIGAMEDVTERKRAEDGIRSSLKEKETLLKEIHHRVKNNLQVMSSLLNLQSQYLSDPVALDIFRASIDRVRSMALIHDKLYRSENLSSISFPGYMRDLTRSLLNTYAIGRKVAVEIDAEPLALTIETAVPVALIINELVSNSLKHAFPEERPGTVTVRFHDDQGSFRLSVIDDGIGFPKGIDFANTQSLGMQLVVTLVDQLDGEIQLERAGGTEFRISFPATQ